MKNYLTFPTFFSVVSLISLYICLGCGDTEDMEESTGSTYSFLLDESDELLESLKDKDWEEVKDEGWVRLTDEEVEDFMNLEIPQQWGFKTEDRSLYEKYLHATYFQRFGDIPAVRYVVEFERGSRGGLITLGLAEQLAAYAEAMYVLFPKAVHLRSLTEAREQLRVIEEREELRFLEQLRTEDPETWVKRKKAALIKRHGDILEVDLVINFLRILELQLPRTDKDCRSYIRAYRTLYEPSENTSLYEYYALLEAEYQIWRLAEGSLRRLKKYRKARVEGISFYDIDWDDN